MRRLALLWSVVVCGCAHHPVSPRPTPTPAIDVPMTSRAFEPVVQMMVNGEGPFLFIVSTGSREPVRIHASLATRLHLRATGKREIADAAGRRTVFDVMRTDSLRIGDATFRGVEVLSRDYARSSMLGSVDGTIGIALFRDYLVTLDYPGHRLHAEMGHLPNADGRQILPLRSTSGVPSVDIVVAGKRVNSLIESGSLTSGFVLPRAVVDRLKFVAPPTEEGVIRSGTAEIATKQGRVEQTISLGQHEFAQPTVIFPGLTRNGSIGSSVLNQFQVTFDSKHHLVRFAAP